jgi:hypothetical protein
MTTHNSPSRPAPPRLGQPLGIVHRHYFDRDYTVTATTAQLANLVARHRSAGTLVAVTSLGPVGDRWRVILRLREYQPARTSNRRSRRIRIAVIVTAVTGTVAGLVAVAAYLIGQLVELIAAHAGPVLGVLALAALLAGTATRRRTGRRHCPGC